MPTQRFAPIKTFTLDSVREVGRKVGDKYTLYNGTGWRPAYLQRRVLILFILLFAGLIAALEVLDHVSNVNYGIASSIESRHYSWTYGPTAILTIVAALWARVEFQAKQNAPWRALQDRANPAEASQSLLLDYVSVMQPVALWNALKKRHAIVAAGISCSLLLRLIIVFSTGLFALQEIPVSKNVDIELIDVFDASNPQFNSSDAAPFDILNGVLFRNGTYPEGTNKQLVYQRFAAPNTSSDAILSAPVLALTSRMNCEPADVRIHEWQWVQGGMTSETRSFLNFTTPSCTVDKVIIEIPNDDIRYVTTFQSAKCVESTNESDDMRILIGAFHVNQTTVFSGAGAMGYDIRTNVSIIRSTQMLCSPSYSLAMVNTTYNATEPLNAQIESLPYTGPSSLTGLTGWDIAEQVAGGEEENDVFKPIVYHDPFSIKGSGKSSIDHPIGMGAWLAERTGDIDILFEDGVLTNISSSYYQAMAAQFMRKGLIQHRNSTTSGSAIVNEQRVVMTELPLRVIEICLALNILLAVAMLVLSSRSKPIFAPWDPNTLSGIANILSQSETLTQTLKGTSAYLPGALRARLKGSRYFSHRSDDGFSIETVDKEVIEKSDEPTEEAEQVERNEQSAASELPSKPLPSLGYRIAIFVSVALVIIALEVVLYQSKKNNGLGDVPNNEYIHYAWTLVPATVMVSLSLSLGSIDSNTRLFAPYARLRSVGATFQESLSLDFRDSLDITLIFNSIRTKHFAVLVTTLAALTASFLTIVTSGLYSPIEVPRQLQISLARNDTFDRYPSTYVPSATDTGFEQSIITAQYIIQANLTYPRWTYENLAFPKLELSDKVKSQVENASFVDLYVPATRSALDCKMIPFSDFNKTVVTYYDTTINVTKVPKMACPPYSIDQAWNGDDSWELIATVGEGTFGITMDHTSCTTKGNISANGGTTYYWGHYEGSTLQHAAGLTCVPGAETVNTKVRFKLPSFDFDLEHPPEPDESSVTTITNQYLPFESFQTPTSIKMMDTVFDALTAGRYAIPKEYLARADKVDEVVKAIRFQDGIIKAQIYSNNTRSANTSLGVSYRGEIQLGTRLRLFQDSISTRVLESLLAFILVLGVLGSILINTDHILPNSPSSIAAMASLLADSNFLHWYRPSPEDDLGIIILGQKLFSGCRFFIGRREQTASSPSSSEPKSENQDDYTVYLDDSSRNDRLLANNFSQPRGPGSREETGNSSD